MSDKSEWVQNCKQSFARELERVYDEVIITGGLEKELKRREELYQHQHMEEVKTREKDRQALSARLIEETIKNSRLVDEVSVLKAQLQNLQAKGSALRSSPRPGNGDQGVGDSSTEYQDVNATVCYEEYRHLANKYNDLSKAHQETLKQLKYQQKKNHAVMEKNRDMKKSVKEWQEYSDRHMKKKPKAEAKSEMHTPAAVGPDEKRNSTRSTISSPKSSRIRSSPCISVLDRLSPLPIAPNVRENALRSMDDLHDTAGDTKDTPMVDISRTEGNEKGKSQGFPHPTGINLAEHATLPRMDMANVLDHVDPNQNMSSVNQISSSQVTEDEILEADPSRSHEKVAVEDDDTPQIVSERCLKRKRTNNIQRKIHPIRGSSDGTPAKPYAVKDERFSSPPAPTPHQLLRKETLDLDELGPNVLSTPHGRLRREQVSLSDAANLLHQRRSASVPIVKQEIIKRENQELFIDNVPRATETIVHDAVVAEARAFSEPTNKPRIKAFALQTMDPNVRSVQWVQTTDDVRPFKRTKREDHRAISAYQTVTESGDDLPPLDENDNQLSPRGARARFNRRLIAGKQAETPTRGVSKMLALATGAGTQSRQVPAPAHSTLTFGDTSSSCTGPRKRPPLNSRLGPKIIPPSDNRLGIGSRPSSRNGVAAGRKKESSLRMKPMSELKASDFKPNPAFNGGYSYAFAETVRKRADRACLPGCTRPECCGSTFRAMAAALPPLPISQEEAVLEEFLGDAYDTVSLTQMPPTERQEFILQARTRQLANKSGKHKQANARRPSPPGYWRTVFPNTQEEEEDRAKAIQIEKRIVEERYMEARRINGQWKFRDE